MFSRKTDRLSDFDDNIICLIPRVNPELPTLFLTPPFVAYATAHPISPNSFISHPNSGPVEAAGRLMKAEQETQAHQHPH